MKLSPVMLCLAAILFTGCIQQNNGDGLAPEQVVKGYFETAAQGDVFGLRQYLTPDGNEVLNEFAESEEIRKALEKQKESQQQFWKGIITGFSPGQLREDGSCMVVVTLLFEGRKTAFPIILHKINGSWKISSHSFYGKRAELMQMEIVKLKMGPVATVPAPASTAAVPSGTAAVQP